MAKQMKLRDLETALTGAGCNVIRDTGRHTVWGCPCGKHKAPVPRHREVSPGVVGSLVKMLECLPKGWLG